MFCKYKLSYGWVFKRFFSYCWKPPKKIDPLLKGIQKLFCCADTPVGNQITDDYLELFF